MKLVLSLLLGVLLLFATSASIVKATEDCSLTVFKNGCFYPDTCVRQWGDCPDIDYCDGTLQLTTDERCKPACVGFGVYSNCAVDLSEYNLLTLGVELLLEGGVESCAVKVKIELEDEHCNKVPVYCWILPRCNDYVFVLKHFSKCLNLCKITGLFLVTAFDVISYEECKEIVLVFNHITFVSKPSYTVFDECSSYQYNGQCFGTNSLYYWPCLPCAAVLSNCSGYARVLSIPCNTWGAGFCGYCQDLSAFKYLSFYLKSNVETKLEIGDGQGCKACYHLDSTCNEWSCIKVPLCDLVGAIDLCQVSWQFMLTKVGCCDSEVQVASIQYLYC